ncbi:hypothetical protein PMIN01_11990 [Paraphaeosphaeria minitans]|uniref:Uncharacterized protein n=1 Tax=Paraphaeosphaeria minitans TaxID=565426 RepID=A0A9P6KKP8_9PLEO|nr:hypothetical protein PMIN01_11990 [Paraphaeosphaeria minitans]
MSSQRQIQKRKRDASVSAAGCKRHSRTLSKKSKQRPANAVQAPTHHPPKPTSKVRARMYAEVQCSEDTGAESSSDGAGNNENNCHVNAKEFQSTDCPRKLYEFHEANPAASGPPRRLSHWELCCEEDRDADDFSDDDKPVKTVRAGCRAVRRGRAAI